MNEVNKKLEQAAKGYAKCYTENDNGNGGDDWEDDIAITFIAGANWQRNIVWHDVAEEPKEEKDLLLIFTCQDGRKSYSIGLYSSHAKNVWVSEGRNFHWKNLSMYSKWAYIDELLPTGINK